MTLDNLISLIESADKSEWSETTGDIVTELNYISIYLSRMSEELVKLINKEIPEATFLRTFKQIDDEYSLEYLESEEPEVSSA